MTKRHLSFEVNHAGTYSETLRLKKPLTQKRVMDHKPMSSLEKITSLQNARIKNLVKLREANHRRRQKRFLIEGRRELERAMSKDWPIEEIYYGEDFFRDAEDYEFLDQLAKSKASIFSLSKEVFDKASYRESPDGWLALATAKDLSLTDFEKRSPSFLLILEGIEKPGNLGAIIRTANAAGIDGILVSESKMELYNPNSIRASQGAFFDLPVIPTDNVETFDFLERNDFTTILTTPDTDEDLWESDLTGKIAIVLGTEDEGLSRDWLDSDFPKAKLPMAGITDSLNVSVAAGICLFEAVRQRQKA